MATASCSPIQIMKGSPMSAQKFLHLGNAELEKAYRPVRRLIRRRARLTISFLTMCLAVVIWSKVLTDRPVTNRLPGVTSNR